MSQREETNAEKRMRDLIKHGNDNFLNDVAILLITLIDLRAQLAEANGKLVDAREGGQRMACGVQTLKAQVADALRERDEAREALRIAINSVECASIGTETDGTQFELPWYRAAKKALNTNDYH